MTKFLEDAITSDQIHESLPAAAVASLQHPAGIFFLPRAITLEVISLPSMGSLSEEVDRIVRERFGVAGHTPLVVGVEVDPLSLDEWLELAKTNKSAAFSRIPQEIVDAVMGDPCDRFPDDSRSDWIKLSQDSVKRSLAELSPEIIDAARRSGTKDTINSDS